MSNILNDPVSISHQLGRSIAIILRTIGFSDATPEAMATFTLVAEEYMDHLLDYVRTCMEAGKRTQAIPFDFEYALNAHQLTLRSLLPHLDPPVFMGKRSSKHFIAPEIQVEEVAVNKDESLLEQFSLGLRGPQTPTKLGYAPRKLPVLPSRHTYKATPVVSDRTQDPKTLRERATEESRLGEEALRRFVGAVQGNGKDLGIVHDQGKGDSAYQKCWNMLLEDGEKDHDRLELRRTDFTGPLVNAESRYWRTNVGNTKALMVNGVGRDPG